MTGAPLLFTVGHGDRTAAEFLDLLGQAGIDLLVDVRRFPASRRHPHFARDALAGALAAAGIGYRWEGERLGGRRRESHPSQHTALHSASFRAYADHMRTSSFRSAVADLLALAEERTLVVMCAERLPWRCHRWFLADALLLAGAGVVHLLAPAQTREHRLSPLARAEGGELIYDRRDDDKPGLDL